MRRDDITYSAEFPSQIQCDSAVTQGDAPILTPHPSAFKFRAISCDLRGNVSADVVQCREC